jgi:hypothetical protein
VIVGGIAVLLSSLQCLSVELCAFSVVYNHSWWICGSVQCFIMNDCGLCACSVVYNGFPCNRVRVQLFIMIFGGI